jgi:hypothetical protein
LQAYSRREKQETNSNEKGDGWVDLEMRRIALIKATHEAMLNGDWVANGELDC